MSELIERTNNKPKIIVLSGQPACGKTSLAKDLAWRDGYNVIYGSDEIREASDQMGITLESNRESYNAAWLEISRQRGRTWLAELAIARALESPGAKIVMESCRNPEDLYLLHQARLNGIIDVASIALDVPITMRFELSRKSDRERGATIEQFSQQEEYEDYPGNNPAGLSTILTMKASDALFLQDIADSKADYFGHIKKYLRDHEFIQ